MSEWEGHVYCTCFQGGLTGEPPCPRSDLTVNRFGIVTLVGSTDHAEDPDALWCWRMGMTENGDDTAPACAHRDIKIVDEIFYWPGSRFHTAQYPVLERVLENADLPMLSELLHRPPADDYRSGGIWATAQESAEALEELRTLRTMLPAEMPADDEYFARTLSKLLGASIATGNPIILHYNGVGDGEW